jgi:hypothetical protein
MSILKEFAVGDKVCGRSTASNNISFNAIGVIKDILRACNIITGSNDVNIVAPFGYLKNGNVRKTKS